MIQLKNEAELEKIRESCLLLTQTHREIAKLVKPGVTTRQLDGFAREFIESRGGRPSFLDYHGYPASICASVNHVVIHGIPDDVPLEEGDILSLDLGIDLGGYFSDAARTLPVGSIAPEVQKLLDVTRECLDRAIEAAVVGNRVRDIGRAVSDLAESHGYGVVYEYCGHGVGFAVHEEPQVPNYPSKGPNPRIKPGMVLALEPMINLGVPEVDVLDDEWTVVTADRALSAHFEHTVAVHRDRTEILTPY